MGFMVTDLFYVTITTTVFLSLNDIYNTVIPILLLKIFVSKSVLTRASAFIHVKRAIANENWPFIIMLCFRLCITGYMVENFSHYPSRCHVRFISSFEFFILYH